MNKCFAIWLKLAAISLTVSQMCAPSYTFAKNLTFTKEYTYQASEADSMISCRAIALEQVKRRLLEEIGTYLESQTEIRNYQLSKDQVIALTAGIVKTDLKAEKWDGKFYYLKVEIVADPDNIAPAIDDLRKDREKTRELEDARRKAAEAGKEIETLKNDIAKLKGKTDSKRMAKYAKATNDLGAVHWFEKGMVFMRALAQFQPDGNGEDIKNAINDLMKSETDPMSAFNKAIELNPTYADAYFERGVLYSLEGKHNLAIQDYDKVIELGFEYQVVYYNRGTQYAWIKEMEKAIHDFDKAIQLSPTDAMSYYQRGQAYIEVENHHLAIQDLSKAIELKSSEDGYYFWRGWEFNKVGNFSKAIQDFNTAIQLRPSKPKDGTDVSLIKWHYEESMIYDMRGEAYARMGDYRLAIEDYNKAIYLEPGVASYFKRGIVYAQIGNDDYAVRDFEKALVYNSKNSGLYYACGSSYNELGQYSKAIIYFNQAIALNPSDPIYFTDRGFAYSNTNEDKLALQDYNRAIELDPNHSSAYRLRGALFFMHKMVAKGCSDFKAACALGETIACDVYNKACKY